MENFEYHRPSKLADAVKLIKAKKDGKLMSGGMTLIPTMKQGLATPSDIIDLTGLKNSGVKVTKTKVTIMAGTTHAEVAENKDLKKALPALAALAGNIGDPQAIPFLIELLDWPYPDQWRERDFKEVALRALGNLKAYDALSKIERELSHGKEESTRQAAAQALGLIGGSSSFAILEKKLEESDAQWVERECLASLNKIAFDEINTNDVKLKASRITAAKGGAEAAFQLTYQSVMNEEPWVIDFFFGNLVEVPMRQNFWQVVELLNSDNKTIFTETTQFLKGLTSLKTAIVFNDAVDKKEMFKQALWNWYQKHSSEIQ